MDLLRTEDVRALVEAPEGDRVSIYMPAHRTWPEAQQDPIRLRNLLREVEGGLADNGLRRPEAERLLAPAQELLDDEDFWQHQGDGLALFLSEDVRRFWRLPVVFDDLAMVGERFHVKPLLRLLTGDGRFLVLALSQDQTRLLQGSRQRVQELQIDVPQGLEELLVVHREERQLQWHTGVGHPSTGRPTRGGRRPAVFHGHGVGKEPDDELLRMYLRRIDEGIREALPHERDPLVVAAVEHLGVMYRDVSEYDTLLEEGVDGNPDDLHPQELHEKAWRIVEPRFRAQIEEAVGRFEAAVGTGLGVSGVAEALVAAHDGRVEVLFVPAERRRWGRYDPQERTADVRDDPKPGDHDLLDLAAVQALLHGGTVYVLEPERLPGDREVAALLRY